MRSSFPQLPPASAHFRRFGYSLATWLQCRPAHCSAHHGAPGLQPSLRHVRRDDPATHSI